MMHCQIWPFSRHASLDQTSQSAWPCSHPRITVSVMTEGKEHTFHLVGNNYNQSSSMAPVNSAGMTPHVLAHGGSKWGTPDLPPWWAPGPGPKVAYIQQARTGSRLPREGSKDAEIRDLRIVHGLITNCQGTSLDPYVPEQPLSRFVPRRGHGKLLFSQS